MGLWSKIQVLGSTLIICFLTFAFLLAEVLPLYNFNLFDTWEFQLSGSEGKKVDTCIKVKEPLNFMLRRLVRGSLFWTRSNSALHSRICMPL
ncbi:hypothetical protein PanWU01x14_291700 [Parasponia andersonii]|uniref:Uncharacterized protein n=1 Tax=Parasponia andersonii TaxID=3476 RepID=A0A2P5AXA4_PARAD|nr:hypothetical protein PanWU01x14_291700 [Parasponia andersonii]